MQIAEISPWLRLEPNLLLPLVSDQAVTHLRHKQPVFHQGDMPSAVYVVKFGRVCVTTYSQSGIEQQLYIAECGALFGEHSCLLKMPHMTSAISIVDSDLYTIPTDIFLARIMDNQTLNQAVMQIMCRKKSLLIDRLLTKSSSDSLQRTAQVLLNMSQEYGIETKDGLEISIRFSHQDVANLLHTSRVTVTKAFQILTRDGIIQRKRNHIIICDPDKLKQFL